MKKYGLWVAFVVFVATAIYLHSGEQLFVSNSAYPAGKSIFWGLFAVFFAYSIYCSSKENIFTTIGKMWRLHWGRQIGIDLYLGLMVSMFIIYLNEGSLLILLLWFIPILLFANLAVLLYFAMNYDSIVALFN